MIGPIIVGITEVGVEEEIIWIDPPSTARRGCSNKISRPSMPMNGEIITERHWNLVQTFD